MDEPPRDRPQNIPLPVGGFVPARSHQRRHVSARWWYRNLPSLIAGAGLVAAASGALLSLSPAAVPVFAGPQAVRVAESVLTTDGPGVYGGRGQAALVLTQTAQVSRGAASAVVGGLHMTGFCFMTHPRPNRYDDACTFVLGSSSFESDDVLLLDRSRAWARRYSDGRQVRIEVPVGSEVIPVPFPVGH